MTKLTQQDLTRFSRHILLPEVGVSGQEKLRAARVLVIGTGGLGSPVSLYLAAAGIGTIGLVEFDMIDRSNLQRQILYTDQDVDKPKISVAANRLSALYPDLKIEKFPESISLENASAIISKFDLVIDGTDNFSTRYLVNDVCVELKKTSIYGSVFRFEGQASVFSPQGPCYRCIFPSPPPAEEVPSCAEGGVLGVLPGLIGMLQATEAVKLILGIGESLVGRLLMFDGLGMRFDEFTVHKDPACKACGPNARPTDLTRPSAQCEVPAQSPSAVPAITPRELAALRDKKIAYTLLDVRAPGETEVCKISGGINIPLAELPVRLGEIDRNLPVVVHCKSGGRSAKATTLLMSHGFKDVKNLTGGILAWISQIEPTLARY